MDERYLDLGAGLPRQHSLGVIDRPASDQAEVVLGQLST
jgi:hypothetical protein